MRKKIILFVFLTSRSLFFYSQNFSLGGGFTAGYKSVYQEQGFCLYSRIKNRVDVYGGYSFVGKYNGVGFGGGARYLILNKRFQPFLGFATSYNYGKKINLESDLVRGVYNLSTNSFGYIESGLIYKYQPQDDPESKFNLVLLLVGSVTYRNVLSPIHVNFIEGVYSKTAEDRLIERAGNGIGGSISLLFLINVKKN